MKITCMTVTAMGVNVYFCVEDAVPGAEKKGIIIDPGGEPAGLGRFIEDEDIKIQAILLTHGHFDHIGAVEKIKILTKAPVYAHRNEVALLGDGKLNMSANMRGRAIELVPDVIMEDNTLLSFGDIKFRVIHLPGHTPGGVAFYFESEKALFSGDVLFHQSIGRTDFESGDADMLISGIREKLYALPDDVTVYPGHGEITKIGYEKKHNPYVKGANPEK